MEEFERRATKGQKYLAEDLWKNSKQPIRFKHCMVDGVWGSVVIDTDAKGDLLYLFSQLIHFQIVRKQYGTVIYKPMNNFRQV